MFFSNHYIDTEITLWYKKEKDTKMTQDNTKEVRFTCRMPDGIYTKIKQEAEKYGISIAAMLKIIAAKYFEI